MCVRRKDIFSPACGPLTKQLMDKGNFSRFLCGKMTAGFAALSFLLKSPRFTLIKLPESLTQSQVRFEIEIGQV
jgi:hypothetical protein